MKSTDFEVYFDYADQCTIFEYPYGTKRSEIQEDYQQWVEHQKDNVKQGWSFRTPFKEGMLSDD